MEGMHAQVWHRVKRAGSGWCSAYIRRQYASPSGSPLATGTPGGLDEGQPG